VKIVILVLLIITNISCDSGIQSDPAIVFTPGWKEGESKIVNSIYKVTQSNEFDSSVVLFENSYKIEVAEVSKEGCILTIELLKSELNSYPEPIEFNDLLNEYNKLSRGIIFKLKFDSKGHYKEFLNWTDIRDYFYNVTDTIASMIKNGKLHSDIDIKDHLINEVKSDYSTREKLSEKLLKPIIPYFDIYHLELHPNTVKKEYLPIMGKSDSLYYTFKNEYTETKDELHLRTYTSTDISQIKKLNNIISGKKLDRRSAEILDAYINTLEDNEYLISKNNYWVNYQRTVSRYDNTSIVREFIIQ